MKRGAVLFLLVGVWQLVRFATVFFTTTISLTTLDNPHLNLLWMGAPGIILAALFFAAAYYPSRTAAYLPVLRVGLMVSVLTDAVVVVTGSYGWTPAAISELFSGGRTLFLVACVILFADLAVFSLLLSLRFTSHSEQAAPRGAAPPRPRESRLRRDQARQPIDEDRLPQYDPTDLNQD